VRHCHYEYHWVCIPSSLIDHGGRQKLKDVWRKPLKCQTFPTGEKAEELAFRVWSVPDHVESTENEEVDL
jgi:hypothetical protein